MCESDKNTVSYCEGAVNIPFFSKFVNKKGKLKEINFGQALIFNTNNYHYIPINKTSKTRWAINIRLKNLFSPYGERNLLDYYELLKISPLSKMYYN